MKRLVLYIIGLFCLSLGASFSIQALLGVAPVSSLPYAFSLSTGLSIGVTTVIANFIFIVIQFILNKKQVELKDYSVQLIIAFLFGFFMEASLFLVQLLPEPAFVIARFGYLMISLFLVSIGLLSYFTSKLPLMPYDALTHVISDRFKLEFGKAKITSDLINVGIAGGLCLVFIQALGSIGIGTLITAYLVGKILGWEIARYQLSLNNWIYKNNHSVPTNVRTEYK